MKVVITAFLAIFLSACANQSQVCEDVTLAKEQIHACKLLEKQIASAKGKPILRTELERRHQQDCVEVRYYRDEHQSEICGNKNKTIDAEQAVIKQQKLK